MRCAVIPSAQVSILYRFMAYRHTQDLSCELLLWSLFFNALGPCALLLHVPATLALYWPSFTSQRLR